MKRICEQCGKVFNVSPYKVAKGKGRYCNRDCYKAVHAPIVRTCEICSKEFSVKPSQVTYGGGKYCGRECQHVGFCGERNPLWRGGSVQYRGRNWGKQRKAAYTRDGGECQICHYKPSKHARQNEVHHIKPYREFNGDYIAANNLLNLVTLCTWCHIQAECGKIPVPKPLL